MSKPLCLIFGVPGSGKSTIAQEIQGARRDVVILDIDDVAQASVAAGATQSIGYAAAFGHLDNFLDRNSRGDFPVVICAGLSKPERWDSIIRTLERHDGFAISCVQLICDPDLAYRRTASRTTVQAAGNTLAGIRNIALLHDSNKVRLGEICSFVNERCDDGHHIVARLLDGLIDR